MMIKADFHIHTSPFKYEPRQFSFSIETLIEYVDSSKLDAIAITNHNHFNEEQFSEIVNLIDSIAIFPGIEIDIERGHLIAIARNEILDSFIISCKKVEERINSQDDYISVDDFKSFFPYYKDLLLIPHYMKDPFLSENIIQKFEGSITAGEVSSPKKFMSCKSKKDSLVPVLFSDLRVENDANRKAFPNKNTYIDIHNTTFETIKTALTDKNKVFLNKDKMSNVFEYTTDGSLASTKLNVIIGKRSSGKTYNLDRVWDTRDTNGKSIHYIKQFSLTGDSEESRFNELRSKEIDSIISSYLSSLKRVTNVALSIDLNKRHRDLQEYIESLKQYANNLELNDEYSKTALFDEILFNYQDKDDIKEIIKSVKVLISTEKNKDLIQAYLGIDNLKKLLSALLLRYKEQLIEKELHDITDRIVKTIKERLKNKSALVPPSDIDVFSVFYDLEFARRFNQLVSSIKTEKIVYQEEVQRFSLFARRRSYTSVTDIKNHVDPLPSISDPYKHFYAKDAFAFIHELKKLGVSEDRIYRCIIAVDVELRNHDGKELSGGERAEFNLIREIQNSSGFDVLLIDEPEASFDNPFIYENVIELLKEMSEKITIFVSTHNNTIGLLMKPNMIIYTEKENGKYYTYHGEIGDEELLSPEGKTVSSYDKIISVMEASDQAYSERRTIYENLKN